MAITIVYMSQITFTKLYPLLFSEEQQQLNLPGVPSPVEEEPTNQKKTNNTSYAPPDFALFEPEMDRELLVLIHVPSLLSYLKTNPPPSDEPPIYDICAGMIEVEDTPENECLGAKQVVHAAGSPKWKGAGIALYALASDHYGAPITSDRRHSSSVAARETWGKIENNGSDWKKVGGGLDNYGINVVGDKNYMDIKGSYPNRSVEDRGVNNPKTPNTKIDDCPLPTKRGDVKNIKKQAELVGTPDAWKYSGSLNKSGPLLNSGAEVMKQIHDNVKVMNPRKINVLDLVTNLGNVLFQARYSGTETKR
jgi:hypothetical protein